MLGICLRYTGDRDTAQDLLHDGFIIPTTLILPFSYTRVYLINAAKIEILHRENNSFSTMIAKVKVMNFNFFIYIIGYGF